MVRSIYRMRERVLGMALNHRLLQVGSESVDPSLLGSQVKSYDTPYQPQDGGTSTELSGDLDSDENLLNMAMGLARMNSWGGNESI